MSASRVRISVSDDRLEVRAVIEPGDEPVERLIIEALLAERQVVRARFLEEGIERCIRESEGNTETIRVPIARGVAPRKPIDAAFVLDPVIDEALRPPATRSEVDEVLEDALGDVLGKEPGGTDHYALTAFCVVGIGDILGTITAPTPGTDGEDVLGATIAVPEPRDVSIDFDEDSVRVRDNVVSSLVSGHVEYSGTSLRVSPTLVIRGYVDFSTGNVDFPGDVEVVKGVRDCFQVTVEGDLVVGDLVEAAQLHTGGDCHLRRGMAAREKGTLDVGRDLQARYLDNVDVTVGRDALIEREVSNCHMQVGRSFRSPRCTIMGGRLDVVGSCEVAQVGSEGGVATDVTIGKMAEVEDLVRDASRLLDEVDARREKVRSRLEQIKGAVGRVNEAAAEELTLLELEIGQWNRALHSICDRIDHLLSMPSCDDAPWLHVHRALHHKVSIWIGPFKAVLTEDLKGPVRIEMEGGTPMVRDVEAETSVEMSRLARVVRDDRYMDVDNVRERVASIRGVHDQAKAA